MVVALVSRRVLVGARALRNQRSNQDPDHYTKFYPAAVEVVQALSSSAGGGSCSVDGNAQALAQELAAAAATGQLRVLEPRYLRQIEDVAAGKPTPNCGIDVGTLQIMVLPMERGTFAMTS
ncbi:hypothetical protein [Agromyces larvae]|uniref:DUF222 domain-containing protein n=1 Tax=Agromyces larvae TaxID=2929802 RepID=A0ABY4C0K7_9MICO|nr:hypothetical protein [Agromyces larvae]UOE43498.1 hypothetical protein MTO99_15150 [Agromyces larvae]